MSNNKEITGMVTRIVTAYVGNHLIAMADLPDLIQSVHETLANVAQAATEEPVSVPAPQPAVAIKKSVTPDFIICLEDGKKLRMLKRHLSAHYQMSPEDYRAKWGLPPDYPMVAPNYAKHRSNLAKRIGLGRRTAEAA
ncbi:MAG: MucR family transcriptional regulator [Azospirillaceae bacterium]|nr:MucR family transcriptional regulator [Azospirillaceae bacterium]